MGMCFFTVPVNNLIDSIPGDEAHDPDCSEVKATFTLKVDSSVALSQHDSQTCY